MKTSKSVILASLFAIALSSAASAATILHITGSTAFRAETTQAIIKALGGAAATFAFNQNATNTATIKNSSNAIIYNSNQSVIVETSWSGSVAGLQALATQTPITSFLSNTTYNPVTGTVKATAGVLAGGVFTGGTSIPAGTAVFDPAIAADVALSDNFPADVVGLNTSQFNPDNQVAIVVFEWARNVGAPADISNVSTAIAQTLLTDGSVTESHFNGNPASTANVFIVGRDNLSGSRYITFAETAFGINSSPVQVEVTANAAGTAVASINPVTGNTGYSSGGLIASAMILTGSNAAGVGGAGPGWLVSYLGLADAQTVISGGGAALTYNGVAATTANVQNGAYSFWAYEHFNTLNTLAGVALTTANAIATQLTNTDAADFGAGVLVPTMNVSRPGDGQPILP